MDLHLVVGPAHMFQFAADDPHEITRAIQPPAGRAVRIGHESCCGIGTSVSVSSREAVAAHVQLADRAGGHRVQPRIEDVRGRTRDRDSDAGLLTAAQRSTHRHADGQFGGTVSVEQPVPRPLPGERRGQRFPRSDQGQPFHFRRQGREHGGREVGVSDALFDDQLLQRFPGEGVLGRCHQRAPVRVRGEQFEHRGVEGVRRRLQHPHAGRGAETFALQVDEGGQSAVRHFDALRGARRPGGVDDVGDVVDAHDR